MRTLAGQLDLFTGNPPERAPAPVVRPRAKAALVAGEVQCARSRAGRDCDDCWFVQHAAVRSGGPVPFRARTAWVRKTTTTVTFLCHAHKTDRETTDRAGGLPDAAVAR